MQKSTLAVKLVPRLFEDSHYLLVAKPAGFGVGVSRQPGAAGLEALAKVFDTPVLLPVHPLDEHVSGVLPLAKSEEAAARLREALASSPSVTEYLAVVEARPGASCTQRPRRGKTSSAALSVKVLRHRQGRSLIAFNHRAARTADVRAVLRAAKLPLLGEGKRRGNEPPQRPTGRIFLHRARLRFRHPYTGQIVTANAPAPAAFKAAFSAADLVEDTLQVALSARIPCLLDPDVDAFRLLCDKFNGVPGLVADKFGPAIILQTHEGRFVGGDDRVRRIAKWYVRTLGATAIYLKRSVKGRDRVMDDDSELGVATPLLGEPLPAEITIREGGLLFLIRPYQGYAAGLFLDQRDNRRRVREMAAGKQVLNLFAYTCGFSVAAAAGGATWTVSVDISAKALEWGRRNLAANGIDPQNHGFIRSEVFDYLKRARRQTLAFDLIVLDAPTFARSKRPARTFSVAEDLRRLIAEATAVLAPRGTMLVSVNNRTCSARWLREQIAAAADDAGRPFQITATPALPLDFAVDPDHAKSAFVRFA